jgi:sugar phosphate isomerase/epimerase
MSSELLQAWPALWLKPGGERARRLKDFETGIQSPYGGSSDGSTTLHPGPSKLSLGGAARLHTTRLFGALPAASVELGSIDGSVGGNNFTPVQFLDYLSSIKLTWAMISLPAAVLGDEPAVRQIREHADRLGIKLQLAFGSVCPSSRSFNAQNGTLEEQVGRALKASQIFGATCMRCVLGGDPERPQIGMHIDNMIKAVRGMRSRIADSGIKLAVENHGGDLQSREMKMMIEAVGPDVMGVCLDSGNPVWMLEDPHMTLEMLIPYAATCHVRDSAVWKVPEGIAVRWVNMGDGTSTSMDGSGNSSRQSRGCRSSSRTSCPQTPGSMPSTTPSSGTTGGKCRRLSSPVRDRRQGTPKWPRPGRGQDRHSSGSKTSRSACATRVICCRGCEGVDGERRSRNKINTETRGHGDKPILQSLGMRGPREETGWLTALAR